MRVIGILLIAQSLVRLGILASTLLRLGLPNLAGRIDGFALLLPGLLGALALTAGVLILLRSPGARTFGLVAAAVLLIMQIYFLGTALWAYSVIREPPAIFVITSFVISPAYILIFIAALIGLARWRPSPSPRPDG